MVRGITRESKEQMQTEELPAERIKGAKNTRGWPEKRTAEFHAPSDTHSRPFYRRDRLSNESFSRYNSPRAVVRYKRSGEPETELKRQ